MDVQRIEILRELANDLRLIAGAIDPCQHRIARMKSACNALGSTCISFLVRYGIEAQRQQHLIAVAAIQNGLLQVAQAPTQLAQALAHGMRTAKNDATRVAAMQFALALEPHTPPRCDFEQPQTVHASAAHALSAQLLDDVSLALAVDTMLVQLASGDCVAIIEALIAARDPRARWLTTELAARNDAPAELRAHVRRLSLHWHGGPSVTALPCQQFISAYQQTHPNGAVTLALTWQRALDQQQRYAVFDICERGSLRAVTCHKASHAFAALVKGNDVPCAATFAQASTRIAAAAAHNRQRGLPLPRAYWEFRHALRPATDERGDLPKRVASTALASGYLRDLRAVGQAQRATQLAEALASTVATPSGSLCATIGTLLLENGQAHVGLHWLTKAVKRQPDCAEAWWNLACAASRCEQPRVMQRALEKFITVAQKGIQLPAVAARLSTAQRLLGLPQAFSTPMRRAPAAAPPC